MVAKAFIAIGCWLASIGCINGQLLTLEDCYGMAKENYPALKKMDLVAKSTDYSIKNANRKFLPQLNLSGQATYQSEVVDYGELFGDNLAAMGLTPPSFSKDQYRVQGEIEQLLFDGRNIHYQKEVTNISGQLQRQSIEVELYAIKERINAIFFSIFLLDAQLELNQLKVANLQSQLDKSEAAYRYGTAYLSDVNELRAEIENTKTTNIDLKGNYSAYLRMLSIFINREVSSSSDLVKPEPFLSTSSINRPELKLFDLQKDVNEAKSKQLRASYLPSVKGFFQGAYGRPTINPMSDEFGSWYVTGIRLSWSLGSLYTIGNERSIYRLGSQSANADKETFIRNVQLDMARQDENVKKYAEMIVQDKKTIELRESVVESASAQLANGVITTHEYIQKVNNENGARQNLILHEIQLLQAQYDLKFKSGN